MLTSQRRFPSTSASSGVAGFAPFLPLSEAEKLLTLNRLETGTQRGRTRSKAAS